jgi:predicted PurR-regulated permease PerM
VLYVGREVLIPIALAILLSFLLSPLVAWLEDWHLHRGAASVIVVGLGLAAAGGLVYVMGDQFVSVIQQLPQYRGELQNKLREIRSHGWIVQKAEQEFRNFSNAATSTQPTAVTSAAVASTTPPTANALFPSAAPTAQKAATTQPDDDHPIPVRIVSNQTLLDIVKDNAGSVFTPLALAFLVVVLVIFMLSTRDDLRDRIIRLVGHGRIDLTTEAMNEVGHRISRYLGALSIVNASYGIVLAGGLWLIGRLLGHGHEFPNVLVWGLLVGLFRFVPYLGIWIGASIPVLLSFAIFPGSSVFFSVIGLIACLEIVVGQFAEPYWYGASTGMSALAVLVAAIFWTWIWGGIGLLLSTPLTACLVVLGKYVPQLHFLDILLGDEPVLSPPVRVYQRLIAGDEDEAADLVRETFEKESLEAAYDQVILPALAMAQHDHRHDRLKTSRLKFIHESLRDVVDELGELARAKQTRKTAAANEQAAKDHKPEEQVPAPRASLPKDCTVNVLCLPAKGVADEIVATMLRQLLELRGYVATSTSSDTLASEMVEMIDRRQAQIVCVSVMPPAATAHARYLCKRIHAQDEKLGMVVGVWLTKADLDKARQQIACTAVLQVVRTMAEAQEQVDQLSHAFRGRGASPTPDDAHSEHESSTMPVTPPVTQSASTESYR